MQKHDISAGWRFTFAPREGWMHAGTFTEARTVDLPHDFRVELARDASSEGDASEAYYLSGIGYYEYELDGSGLADKRVLVSFDGIYHQSEIRLNGDLIAMHAGGYTPFFCDLTGKLTAGINQLRVRVSASALPCSRWYPGAGIYRRVHLLTAPREGYIRENGVIVTTETADEALSQLSVRTELHLRAGLYTLTVTATERGSSAPCAVLSHPFRVEGDGDVCITLPLTVAPAKLWNADTPHLYTVTAAVQPENAPDLTDAMSVTCGIRTVALADDGLHINGVRTKLKGGCVHHDNGILGARSYPASEQRKVQKLKACGFNAVRCAHNPPSDDFLEACDALGLYVIDEFFDAWNEGKRTYDEHLFFASEWEREMESTIARDRNRACVVLWSTGNEILERDGRSDGYAWAERLAAKVRALDSTRLVTNALCGLWDGDPAKPDYDISAYPDRWAAKTDKFAAPLDVVGYNYLLDRYARDHERFPTRFIAGTESFPLEAYENWEAVQNNDFVIGDFVWTAWDYLGESGIGHARFDGKDANGLREFPWHTAWCGDIDICGNKRPQSHYRDFVWSGRIAPYMAVTPPQYHGQAEKISRWGWAELEESWTYPAYEGKPITVTVYASGDTVQLFINGRQVGEAAPEKYIAHFEVLYESGVIEAVSLRDGAVLGRVSMRTSGAPSALRLSPESYGELTFYHIEIIDASGERVPYANDLVQVSGDVLAIGSSDPCGAENHTGCACRAYQGRLTVVAKGAIQATREPSNP